MKQIPVELIGSWTSSSMEFGRTSVSQCLSVTVSQCLSVSLSQCQSVTAAAHSGKDLRCFFSSGAAQQYINTTLLHTGGFSTTQQSMLCSFSPSLRSSNRRFWFRDVNVDLHSALNQNTSTSVEVYPDQLHRSYSLLSHSVHEADDCWELNPSRLRSDSPHPPAPRDKNTSGVRGHAAPAERHATFTIPYLLFELFSDHLPVFELREEAKRNSHRKNINPEPSLVMQRKKKKKKKKKRLSEIDGEKSRRKFLTESCGVIKHPPANSRENWTQTNHHSHSHPRPIQSHQLTSAAVGLWEEAGESREKPSQASELSSDRVNLRSTTKEPLHESGTCEKHQPRSVPLTNAPLQLECFRISGVETLTSKLLALQAPGNLSSCIFKHASCRPAAFNRARSFLIGGFQNETFGNWSQRLIAAHLPKPVILFYWQSKHR
ncbi:unnamed protein product [Pleuronectes platessa]|uniref:Uncharacterized protein n=1 Tax=Pleuronectes platessa TaxID=8262 RepID=A0A9N7U1D8_PLEPL|nr:unnamed protein product [Pleuronectes platessa]